MQIHHKSPIRDRPNLVPIVCPCEAEQQPITQFNSKLALWNCRSIKSKTSGICDAVLSEKLDIVLTETRWMAIPGIVLSWLILPTISVITNSFMCRDMVVVAELQVL